MPGRAEKVAVRGIVAGFEDGGGLHANADMGVSDIQQFCQLAPETRQLIEVSVKRLQMSVRAYHRVLKLSRTIADLDGRERIEVQHLVGRFCAARSSTARSEYNPYALYHAISQVGLIGDSIPRPSEVMLSYHGVLFLDEMFRLGTKVLEVLRPPIEDKVVTISRAKSSLTFDANFLLIGALTACP